MIDDMELASLLDDVRSGSEAAFATLVGRVQVQVREWAGRHTDDRDAAEDIAQDVLIGLRRSVQRFDGRSRFSTWLYAVTRNAALDHRRTEHRRAELRAGMVAEVASVPAETQDDEVAQAVLRHFDALPPKQRLVFELVDLRGLEPAEVARQLGMNQVTVRAHLFKARRSIRTRMLASDKSLIREWLS